MKEWFFNKTRKVRWYLKTSMRFVQPDAQINADYDIVSWSSSFGEEKKMIYHLQVIPQKRPSPSWINPYVKPEEWMLKSAPMNYSIWSYLKQQLNKQKIELKKEILYQWKKIDKVLANWPKQAYRISKARAFHIEHRLKLSLLSFFEIKMSKNKWIMLYIFSCWHW